MRIYDRAFYDDEDNSISLLTTLLVRYPELCTIIYFPKGNLLKLSFILNDEIDKTTFKHFNNELIECVSTYIFFEDCPDPLQFKVNYTLGPGVTIIEITRDTTTLTQKEIGLIVNHLHECFDQIVVSEASYIRKDDMVEHDDIIRYMLENIRKRQPKNKFIAVREEGRVLVFKR